MTDFVIVQLALAISVLIAGYGVFRWAGHGR